MTDINTYANDLLIDFLDATHIELKRLLEAQFGEEWFRAGVEKTIGGNAIERARQMLSSPMATVDMGKNDEELYGVEHLSGVVSGNWSQIFKDVFGNRQRTEVYLGEIAELRHNVSHRRQHHLLRRRELLRFVHNAHLLLEALDSAEANRFETLAERLEQGDSPWGNDLAGMLPPAIEIVPEFVGRDKEMSELSEWLLDESRAPIVLWGYGGSGKSALAYQFAREVRYGPRAPYRL